MESGPSPLYLAMRCVFLFAATVANFLKSLYLNQLLTQHYGLKWIDLQDDSINRTENSKKETVINRAIIHNIGDSPILEEDIYEPLKWRGSGRVLEAKVLATNPPVRLQFERKKETVSISWRLFNQGCKALIEIESETDVNDTTDGLSWYQIKALPTIKQETISIKDHQIALRDWRYVKSWWAILLISLILVAMVAMRLNFQTLGIGFQLLDTLMLFIVALWFGLSIGYMIRFLSNPYLEFLQIEANSK